MKYNYLIVGLNLFDSIFAYEANKKWIIDERNYIGRNIYIVRVYLQKQLLYLYLIALYIFHIIIEAIKCVKDEMNV